MFPADHLVFFTLKTYRAMQHVLGRREMHTRFKCGKAEARIPHGRLRRRWGCSIKMDRKELGWKGVDWIDLAQETKKWLALVHAVIKFRVP
jgi:hypothetical protein